MTKKYLISANTITDMDRYTKKCLSAGSETLRKCETKPVIAPFDSDTVEGEWRCNHTFVAAFPSANTAQAWRNEETFNSVELEQPREPGFEEYNSFFASEFEPGSGVTELDDTDHE